MTASGPLAGRRIVITRPRAQSAPLAEAIRAEGGEPIIFPLLEIHPPDDPAPLEAAASRLADYTFAIFISPNAVDHALPAILRHGAWPAGTQAAGIGPGTAKALAAFGIQTCLLPDTRFDSEGLLERPELASNAVNGHRIAIFRGNGGRELLADTLRARGATVDLIPCYRRDGRCDGLADLIAQTPDAYTLSSSEALRHLMASASPSEIEALRRSLFFLPHARIAETARMLGLANIVQTAPADAGLLQGLRAYNWTA